MRIIPPNTADQRGAGLMGWVTRQVRRLLWRLDPHRHLVALDRCDHGRTNPDAWCAVCSLDMT